MKSSTNASLGRSLASPAMRSSRDTSANSNNSNSVKSASSQQSSSSNNSVSAAQQRANNAQLASSPIGTTPRNRRTASGSGGNHQSNNASTLHEDDELLPQEASVDLRNEFGLSSSTRAGGVSGRHRSSTDDDERHVKGHRLAGATKRQKMIAASTGLVNIVLIALMSTNYTSPLICPAPPELQSIVTRSSQLSALLNGQNLDEIDLPNDLSATKFDLTRHEKTWHYCPLDAKPSIAELPSSYCSDLPENEQIWQVGWYGGQVAVGASTKRHSPDRVKCVQLPPPDYRWPSKHVPLPYKTSGVHWPNLRVKELNDLIRFNRGTPKNLYHFDAPVYDLDGLDEAKTAATHIPFGSKVRHLLDIGAGGGSLGLVLHQKYDVETLNIIFPDWPYCEYHTERGNLCVLVDVMEAMPFAKWTWDVLHVSWVYHGQQPDELVEMYLELNRVLRPGGYLWQRGGWSAVQVKAMRSLFEKLGYKAIYDKEEQKPKAVADKISFGPDLPYTTDWTCIWVKPSIGEVAPASDCSDKPVTEPQPTKVEIIKEAVVEKVAESKQTVKDGAEKMKESIKNVAENISESVKEKSAQVSEKVAEMTDKVKAATETTPTPTPTPQASSSETKAM